MSDILHVEAGSVVIVAQDKGAAAGEQWHAALAHIRSAIDQEKGVMSRVSGLVVSDGGAPTVEQRGAMKDLLAGRAYRISVTSDVALVRTVVGIMSWFNSDMKIVPPRRYEEWFSHAGISAHEYDAALSKLDALAVRLGGVSTIAQVRAHVAGTAGTGKRG